MHAKLNIRKYIKASQTPERLAGRAHAHDQSHQRVPERQLLPSPPTLPPRPLWRRGSRENGAGDSRSISILPRPQQPSAPAFPPARESAPQSRRLPAVHLRPRHARGGAALNPGASREQGRPRRVLETPGPDWSRAGRRKRGGASTPGVTSIEAATPSSCAVTAPAAEAGRADRCSRP